jgi:hypothetical protein
MRHSCGSLSGSIRYLRGPLRTHTRCTCGCGFSLPGTYTRAYRFGRGAPLVVCCVGRGRRQGVSSVPAHVQTQQSRRFRLRLRGAGGAVGCWAGRQGAGAELLCVGGSSVLQAVACQPGVCFAGPPPARLQGVVRVGAVGADSTVEGCVAPMACVALISIDAGRCRLLQ